jgi:hypothetical protein
MRKFSRELKKMSLLQSWEKKMKQNVLYAKLSCL